MRAIAIGWLALVKEHPAGRVGQLCRFVHVNKAPGQGEGDKGRDA